MMGGSFVVARTDPFQSLVMLVGIIWIFVACLVHLGGFTAAPTWLPATWPVV